MKPKRLHRAWPLPTLLLAITACGGDSFSPQYVDSVGVTPASVFAVPGGEVTVTAHVSGPNGEHFADRTSRVEWSIRDPSVATLEVTDDGVVVIRGLVQGVTRLDAELGRGTGSAPVYVVPPGLDHVTIEPSTIVIDFPGGQGVRAFLWNAEGNQLDPNDYHMRWEVGNDDIANLLYEDASPTSVRALGRGTTTLTLRAGGMSATASILVR